MCTGCTLVRYFAVLVEITGTAMVMVPGAGMAGLLLLGCTMATAR